MMECSTKGNPTSGFKLITGKAVGMLLAGVLVSNFAIAQTRSLTGVVSDTKTNEPLIGAGVTVKGQEQSTMTDENGNFTIEINEGTDAVLIIESVGYDQQEIAVGSQQSVSVKMASGKAIDEVVVVGYGTQKAANVTGALAKMSGEGLDERPITRVDQALIGQMSGVQVKQTTGAPGKPFSIAVRGTGSISAGTEPLYVIDGFPLTTTTINGAGNFASGSPLDNINPNDIESIQVLKDAAAAAIYGSRASNGVVIITTKQGKSGKAQITFNTYAGVSMASKKLDVLTADEWVARAKTMIDQEWVASGTGRTADQTYDERYAILGNKFNAQLMKDPRWDMPGHPGLNYIDWQDEAFRTGAFQNYQLSASGGSDFVKYYISGNYQNQDGFVIGMGYKAFSMRANVEAKLSKKFKVGVNLAPTYSIRTDPGVEGKDNLLHQLVVFAPVIEDTMGLNPNAGKNGQYSWSGSSNSPITRMNERVGENRMYRNLATAYAEWQPVTGLTAKSTVNFDNVDNTEKVFRPYTSSGSLDSRIKTPNLNSTGSYNTYRRQNIVNENTVTYAKSFNEKHNLTLLAGHSYSWFKTYVSELTSNGGYANGAVATLNNSALRATGTNTENQSVLASFFGRVQYDYLGRYLISASVRTDGSSRFGPERKWGTFSSVSLGWRVSDEKFFKNNISVINDLKLRASFGQNGSNNIGDYSSYTMLNAYNYAYNNTLAAGLGQSNLGDPNLGWEKSNAFNYGVDVSLLRNRIFASFDYYTKESTDLLLSTPVHSTTGVSNFLTNVGAVKNKGWDFEVTSHTLTGKFQWTTSLNVSHNNNKVVRLNGTQNRIDITQGFGANAYAVMEVGLPMYSIKVVQQDGVLTQDDIENGYPMFGPQKVGDPRYVDVNGDGKITDLDRVVVGKPNADYIFGITNTFKYKNFDLTVLVQGQTGGSIYSLFGRAINLTGMPSNQNVLDVDVAERGNYRTKFGAISNTDWLYSSDYLSIRNITLGYNIRNTFANKYVKGARIYVSLENWFRWDKYHGGFNPEATNANLSGDDNFPMPGDYGGLPVAKSLVVGLNFNF